MKISTAYDLKKIDNNCIVSVAGLVTLRQRPGTANGVMFLSLEDETGSINVICWKSIYNKFHREILLSKLILVEGTIQKECGTINIIAQSVKDISEMLDLLPYIDCF